MNNTEYATAAELRQWADSRNIQIPRRGKLPWALVSAWDRLHPDRPYKANQHGTWSYYSNHACRCDPCTAAATKYMGNLRSP